MIGVVIVAHAGLADAFKATLEHVVGRQERLEPFSIGPEDDIEQRRTELIEAIRRVDAGQGVVVLTDMATTSKSASTFPASPPVPCACKRSV